MEKFVVFPPKIKNKNADFVPIFLVEKMKKCVGKEEYWSKFATNRKRKENLCFIVLMKLNLYSIY